MLDLPESVALFYPFNGKSAMSVAGGLVVGSYDFRKQLFPK